MVYYFQKIMKNSQNIQNDILTLLQAMYPDSSKSTLRSWIQQKRIYVDGKTVVSAKQEVHPGQKIEVGKKTTILHDDVEILYEDKELVVIHKPAGLLSVATKFDTVHTAHSVLKKRNPGKVVYPVHRLDRETSGVMVFAYSVGAREHFKKLFYTHDIERKYVAIVENTLSSQQGTWKSYLAEDAAYFVESKDNPSKAKLAITHYKVIAHKRKATVLELNLETGRKNQIRVHCTENGHPIIGDKKYGASTDPIKRLGLHAAALGFIHPTTKKKMLFSKPLPESFQKFIP